MRGLRYLFVDMNSFFASVEQQERPALRGQPVAVAPVLADSTCCIAASYESKAYGIQDRHAGARRAAALPAQRADVQLCRDTLTLVRAMEPLWDARPPGALLKVGIVLTHLVPQGSATLPLYAEQAYLDVLADHMCSTASMASTPSTSVACGVHRRRCRRGFRLRRFR